MTEYPNPRHFGEVPKEHFWVASDKFGQSSPISTAGVNESAAYRMRLINLHRRTDGNHIIQLFRIVVVHTDTAMADSLTYGPRLIGSMNTVYAPGNIKLHEVSSKLLSPQALFYDFPVSQRSWS